MIKNIGIIGQGFVGGSITKFFKDKTPTHTFDLNGNGFNKKMLNLSHLKSGAYFLSFETENQIIREKLMERMQLMLLMLRQLPGQPFFLLIK